jgi:RNA polymerase sigma-70 factor (ECF subfamily)
VSSSFPAARFPALALQSDATAAEPVQKNLSAVELSDEILIAKICADDSQALGLLFQRYSRLVWTIALRILRNREEADDLVQDVFLLVRRRASAFDASKGSVRSLLVLMTYRRAFSRRRDLTRQNFYSSEELTENVARAEQSCSVQFYDESLEAHFGKISLQKAVQTLSVEQRETLRLCFGQGYTFEEIALRTGGTPSNTRHHYYRGLAKLRKHLVKA